MNLRAMQGSWRIFSEMLAVSLQLSFRFQSSIQTLFPEDEFLSYVCTAKDSSAEFFSVLTATINMGLQEGRANIGYM
jgi:hypothetical protein